MAYRFWRLLSEVVETATTWSAAAGAAQISPYPVDLDSQLIGIRVLSSRQTASSLVNMLQIRLTCTNWKPNAIHVAAFGSGLQTAPAISPNQLDFEVNEPCLSGVPIAVESRNTYANAVTPDILVMGLFEAP